ncbi:hypothetical protein MMC27_000616 [Xylographa pallens]|nr:hypothetical protein [Xylographa pallens]
MDCVEELERLALNAAEETPSLDQAPSADEIARWTHLFHYSPSTATALIQQQRNDPTRKKVSKAHWAAVHARWECAGYDHLAYEHELFILRLSGPLSTPSQLQSAAGLSAPPTIFAGEGSHGPAHFCIVDAPTRHSLSRWLAHSHPAFRPTFIHYFPAAKNLSRTSVHPTLGIDATLPQHRLDDCAQEPLPRQDQYPVWYFFYGTLCDPAVLAAQLGVARDTPLGLQDARVRGGVLKTWARRYKALVDEPPGRGGGGVVDGKAYAVRSAEEEEALRGYETGAYEVVRCEIELRGGKEAVKGCTFRFQGLGRELS